ncbi:MAG: hypothetical protein JST77_08170 [Acidobacteria bacterium]|nr:hypothetical protein [Acidobacteriota bacterium]
MAITIRVLWAISFLLAFFIVLVMTRKKQYRDFPAFYAYLLLNLVQLPVIYWVYAVKGFSSWTAFYTAWISQATIVLARWLAVCELCRGILGHFKGIWGLAWRLLTLVGASALIVAIWLGGHDFMRLVSTFDLGLELSIASVLLVFFLFARFYNVQVESSLRSMGIAFCLYSCFRFLNDSVLQKFLQDYANTWSLVDGATYLATLVLIGCALYVMQERPSRKVNLLPRGVYGQFVPLANDRLAALNERLSDLLKSSAGGKV